MVEKLQNFKISKIQKFNSKFKISKFRYSKLPTRSYVPHTRHCTPPFSPPSPLTHLPFSPPPPPPRSRPPPQQQKKVQPYTHRDPTFQFSTVEPFLCSGLLTFLAAPEKVLGAVWESFHHLRPLTQHHHVIVSQGRVAGLPCLADTIGERPG